MNETVNISDMSSDEVIDHYVTLLCRQAESMKAGEVNYEHARMLALLHTARSLDQIEYRMFHLINALKDIRATLERQL